MTLKNVHSKEVMLIKWLSCKCRSILSKGGRLKGKLPQYVSKRLGRNKSTESDVE